MACRSNGLFRRGGRCNLCQIRRTNGAGQDAAQDGKRKGSFSDGRKHVFSP